MQLLTRINEFVWGIPALLLILTVGIYLSIRTGFIQFRLLPRALRTFFNTMLGRRKTDDGVSPFQALCTALAATVGTGNLAGVAGAIAIGGPGSIFWMWMCAILGMVTKFAEVTLAMKYRVRGSGGEMLGGPMYMIREGMGKRWNWLACCYCFFGVVAAFGVGNATQINTMIGGINTAVCAFGGRASKSLDLILGVCFAVMIAVILLGGAKRIGRIAEQLVPFASAVYILLSLGLLVLRAAEIPQALYAIVKGAFCPQAVTGGVIGSAFQALRVGTSRGVFTNEAGMGTASIAHSTSSATDPVEQGMMGIVEVFLDTVVICTLTGLAILCSGAEILYGCDTGVVLTGNAFAAVFGSWVSVLLAIILCCFAIATVIGWGLYGLRCAQYLFGDGSYKWFVALQSLTVVVAAMLRTDTVWILAEIVNGFMSIPNLVALGCLSPMIPGFRKKSVDISQSCARM